MSRLEQFKCDGCGKLRTDDANHWWVLGKSTEGVLVMDRFSHGGRMDDRYERFDFCGQQCALAFISAQMAGGKG